MPTSSATQTRLNMPRHPIFCQRQSGVVGDSIYTRTDQTKLFYCVGLGSVNWTIIALNVFILLISAGDSHESSKIQFTTRRDKTILWSRVRRCELGVRFNVPLDIKWVISGKAVTRVVFWVFEHRHPKFQMKIWQKKAGARKSPSAPRPFGPWASAKHPWK